MRAIKNIIKYLLKGVFLLFILWLILLALLQTKWGQDVTSANLIAFIEKTTGTNVNIGEIHFSFPLNLRMEAITISQDNQKLMEIEKINLQCAYTKLLQGKLVFSYIGISGVNLLRLPPPSKVQTTELKGERPAERLLLPFYIKLESVVIEQIKIKPELLSSLGLNKTMSEWAALHKISVDGTITNNPFRKSLTAHVMVNIEDAPRNLAVLGIEIAYEQLSLSLHIDQLALHTIPLLEESLFSSRKVNISLHASGPLSAWENLVNKTEEENTLLYGNGKIELIGNGMQDEQATLQTQFSFNKFQASGTAELLSTYQNISWRVTGDLHLADLHKMTLSKIQINPIQSKITGELSCTIPDFLWSGKLDAELENLEELSSIIHQKIKGKGKLTLECSTLQNHQEYKIYGSGENIKWEELSAKEINFNYDTKNPNSGFPIQWKAKEIERTGSVMERAEGLIMVLEDREEYIFAIEKLQIGSLYLEEAHGTTSTIRDSTEYPFFLAGKGKFAQNISLTTNGSWHIAGDNIKVQVDHLNGQFGPYPFALNQPLYFFKTPFQTELTGLWFVVKETAELQGEFYKNGALVNGNFTANATASALLHELIPEWPLRGRAVFKGKLEGSIAEPKGEVHIDLEDMQMDEPIFAQNPLIHGNIDLLIDQKGAELTSEIHGIGDSPLTISGHIPLTLSIDPPAVTMSSHTPLNLLVQARGELDPYLHLFFDKGANVSGHTTLAIHLAGSLDAITITGNAKLVNGSYESLSTGALYHDIEVDVEGEGNHLVVSQFSAKDKKNGVISGSGSIELDREKEFPFSFAIHPNQMSLLDADFAEISASGALTLAGNSKSAKLKGTLEIDRATIHLEEAAPRSIKHIPIQYINNQETSSQTDASQESKPGIPIELDVKVSAPGTVFIVDKKLESRWKGSLSITGDEENPLFHGDLRVMEGKYDFNGKPFILTQGNIHFAGAIEKKTGLYVIASREIDKITAEIILKGPVSDPVISFRSTPPLSQKEVLSYILFNRGISDITSDQEDQLSQPFISLQTDGGTENGDDFLTRIRNNIGLDRLGFSTSSEGGDANPDLELQVGKRVTDNIMVSVRQSITSIAPIIAVEAKLMKNLKAEAEAGVGEDTPIRISLKWKKDY